MMHHMASSLSALSNDHISTHESQCYQCEPHFCMPDGYCTRRSRRWGTSMLLVLVSTVMTHTNDSPKLHCAAYIWKRQYCRLLSAGSQHERGDDAGADRNFNRQGQWLEALSRSWQLAQVNPHDLHDHHQACKSRKSCGLTVNEIGPKYIALWKGRICPTGTRVRCSNIYVTLPTHAYITSSDDMVSTNAGSSPLLSVLSSYLSTSLFSIESGCKDLSAVRHNNW